MELLIGIAVVFILLLCLGVSLEIIFQIAIGIICLFVIFMAGVFVYATIILITGKRVKGVYVRVDKGKDNRLPFARYLIDGEEYINLFPLEVIFQNKIYIPDKEVNLVLNKKVKKCMDTNAVICCIVGIIVSVCLLVWMYMLIFGKF